MTRSSKAYLHIIWDLMRDPHGLTKLFSTFKSLLQARAAAKAWVPSSIIKTSTGGSFADLCVHLHVFNESYFDKALVLTRNYKAAGLVVITTPSEQLMSSFKIALVGQSNIEVVLVENQGRNFGAMVQILNKISEFKYLLHLHSKISVQMSIRRSEKWANAFWNQLASTSNVARILQIFETRPSFSLAMPELSDSLPRHAYGWGRNRAIAHALLPGQPLPPQEARFPFPAGGMFLARTTPIIELLSLVGVKDFPEEPLPLDGTIAHAIERLIGVYVLNKGSQILIVSNQNLLTDDLSFINHQGRWG